MAFKLGDRARETSTAPGTGSFTVNGAVQGAQSLASILTVNGDTAWYFADNGTAWETGLLTRTSATVYARTTIFSSSNAGAAANFSAGLVSISIDLPASRIMAPALETLASATTTDLGSVIAQSIIISGTVTITGLGSSAPQGAVKFVEFSGALTLTHNGTSLILPGAANITTVAGDTMTARHEGSGNWRVLHYSRGTLAPIDGAAWTSYSPTVTASTGTFTAVSATGFYQQRGKTIIGRADITVTTIGSAAARMKVTLPVTAINALASIGRGFNETTLKTVNCEIYDSNLVATVVYYDGTFPALTGQNVHISFQYEAA